MPAEPGELVELEHSGIDGASSDLAPADALEPIVSVPDSRSEDEQGRRMLTHQIDGVGSLGDPIDFDPVFGMQCYPSQLMNYTTPTSGSWPEHVDLDTWGLHMQGKVAQHQRQETEQQQSFLGQRALLVHARQNASQKTMQPWPINHALQTGFVENVHSTVNQPISVESLHFHQAGSSPAPLDHAVDLYCADAGFLFSNASPESESIGTDEDLEKTLQWLRNQGTMPELDWNMT